MFQSILSSSGDGLVLSQAVICTLVSLILGLAISIIYMYTGACSKEFAMTLSLLPILVQIVIMLVNGNLGTGVAILGAFSLVRFRSIPGSSKEITGVFFSMAIGLATGMGYVGFAIFATIVIGVLFIVLCKTKFGQVRQLDKDLKITIPENLEYTSLFDDIFTKYTTKVFLESVKTTNLGSMFELRYKISLKKADDEKQMIDEIRCRNGNLTIMCGRQATQKDVL